MGTRGVLSTFIVELSIRFNLSMKRLDYSSLAFFDTAC